MLWFKTRLAIPLGRALRTRSVKYHRALATLPPQFPQLDGQVDTSSASFKSNAAAMAVLTEEINQVLAKSTAGGGEKPVALHKKRNKMLPRERIRGLLDPEAEFLELSPIAGYEIYKGIEVPSAGVVTGIGRVHGMECIVTCNDATVKGGTTFPISLKKQLRAIEIGWQNRLPCIYLVDSGGAFLPMQSEIFADVTGGGRMFYSEAVMSAEKIPQIAAVMGSCTAGGAYAPAMCDEVVIVQKTGTVFLGGPPLVKAATGEIVTAEELGGADVHCEISGLTDHYAENDSHALEMVRHIVANLNQQPPTPRNCESEEPLFSPDEINGLISISKGSIDVNMRALLARVLDGSRLFEFKPRYGPTLITGFARLDGRTVGVIANDGPLSYQACLKGTHLIELCTQRGVPVLFFTNTKGFVNGGDGHELRDAGKMIAAAACANIPKISMVVGAAVGPASYPMCPKSSSPRFLFSYPTARRVIADEHSIMEAVEAGAFEANGIIPQGIPEEVKAEEIGKIGSKLSRQGAAVYASARCWDDGVINPADTRRVLAHALRVTANTTPQGTEFPAFRL